MITYLWRVCLVFCAFCIVTSVAVEFWSLVNVTHCALCSLCFFLQTVRFKNELERNITIKLGYANAKIYKSEDERCPRPMCYK